MKKIIIAIVVLVVILAGIGGFAFTKKSEIEAVRTQITQISDSSEYYQTLDTSVKEMLKVGGINKAHEKWIKEFIISELPKNNYEQSFDFLIKKMRNKNLRFTGKQQDLMKIEMIEIKEASLTRKENVDNAIKSYKKLRANGMYATIEDTLIGPELNVQDVKYY